jgi:hypothetical protein
MVVVDPESRRFRVTRVVARRNEQRESLLESTLRDPSETTAQVVGVCVEDIKHGERKRSRFFGRAIANETAEDKERSRASESGNTPALRLPPRHVEIRFISS